MVILDPSPSLCSSKSPHSNKPTADLSLGRVRAANSKVCHLNWIRWPAIHRDIFDGGVIAKLKNMPNISQQEKCMAFFLP